MHDDGESSSDETSNTVDGLESSKNDDVFDHDESIEHALVSKFRGACKSSWDHNLTNLRFSETSLSDEDWSILKENRLLSRL